MNSPRRLSGPTCRRLPLTLWTESWFLSLSSMPPSGRALWLFLATRPSTTAIPGLVRAGLGAIGEELGWSRAEVDRALAELEASGAAIVDRDSRVLFVPHVLEANPPQSPNVARGWAAALVDVPASPVLAAVVERIGAQLQQLGPAWVRAFASVPRTWMPRTDDAREV